MIQHISVRWMGHRPVVVKQRIGHIAIKAMGGLHIIIHLEVGIACMYCHRLKLVHMCVRAARLANKPENSSFGGVIFVSVYIV